MLAVPTDKPRADRSETTDCHVTHRSVLVDIAVRVKPHVTQSAMRINSSVTSETRIEDRASVFDERSLPERRAQNVTLFPNLNLISVEIRLHHTRPKPNPDVRIPALILRMKNQAFKILNQICFIRG